MTECVGRDALGDPRLGRGPADSSLDSRLVKVVAAADPAARVYGELWCGEDPVPAPPVRSVGVLAREGVGKPHAGWRKLRSWCVRAEPVMLRLGIIKETCDQQIEALKRQIMQLRDR